ncbi:murein L,D-transpeptidase catalytic domain family protein [soil metagenome]
MPARSLLLGALLASLLAAGCAGDLTDEEEDPTLVDSVTADELRSGLASTKGFVEPSPSASELDAIMGRYERLDPSHKIAENLMRAAVPYYDANKSRLNNAAKMVVVDFALASGRDRFFVIDMVSGAVAGYKVAHGSGSDPNHDGVATSFSNVNDSKKSSLGFVLTAETYSGAHGRSLRLDGLSSTDSNMRARAIVLHGASYVHEDSSGIQGRSFGCFAMDQGVKDGVINAVKGGALLYAGLGAR